MAKLVKKIKLSKETVLFFGAPVVAPPVLLLESGGKLLLESGGKIKLET